MASSIPSIKVVLKPISYDNDACILLEIMKFMVIYLSITDENEEQESIIRMKMLYTVKIIPNWNQVLWKIFALIEHLHHAARGFFVKQKQKQTTTTKKNILLKNVLQHWRNFGIKEI